MQLKMPARPLVMPALHFIEISSGEGHCHNGNDQDDGESPHKKSDAVYNERHNWVVMIKVDDAFHRVVFC
jgi:hypothetical protein